MSPEQALGTPVDGRSDVYSLGCMLYEMLSGAPPFSGASVQAVVARHVSDPVPSLRTVRATVPAGLERIVNKALAKTPADRFATAGELAAALPQHVDLLAAEPELPTAPPTRLWHRWVAGVGGALLLAALGPWLMTRGGNSPERVRFTSLAVQPFRNLTGDTAQAFLAEGATDQVVNSLVRLSALRVINLRGANPEAVPGLLRDNEVGAVLTGSVLRVGEAVRITVQLSAPSGEALPGGGTYTGPMTDLLALQDQVARSVADSIRVSMTPQERSRLGAVRREVSPAAYEAYARGWVLLGKGTGGDTRQSIAYFNRAIAADSGYADAWSGLAEAHAMQGYAGVVPPIEAFPAARAAAVRTLALDSTNGRAHSILGLIEYMFTWDFASAERAYQRAVDLSPGDARVHFSYGTYLAAVGRAQESIAELTLAQELDPASLIISAAAARPYYNARRYDEAIAQSFKTLELDSSFTRALFWLGLSYEQTSRIPEAVRTLERLVTLAPLPVYQAALGHAYAVAGRRADAERVLEELQAQGRSGYVASFDIATIHAGLGNRSELLDWLERAYEGRATYLPFVNVDPRFDAFRADPRFRELVRRMGLPEAP
jgi:serine/threonine-protein kinase